MTSYRYRQNRRFNNTVRAVRRNPFAKFVQNSMGISDASTHRQIRRAGNIIRDKFSSVNPLRAQDISGMGAYRVHAGSGFSNSTSRRTRFGDSGRMSDNTSKRRSAFSKPRVRLEKGEMCIEHSEYIGDLISSTATGAFSSQNYPINPGNSGTFPWLSAVAINFQDYRFKKLVFEYRPLVSESSSSASGNLLSMGAVIFATQYDSVTGPYINKNTMENSEYSVSAKPSERLVHAVECNPRYNPLGVLYVSGNEGISNTNVSNSDIRMQNLGIFQAASSGQPGTSLDLGEIWVHYEIELYKPQLNAGLTNLLSGHWTDSTATGSQATTTPFGPNVIPAVGVSGQTGTLGIQPTQAPGSLLNCTFAADGTVTFPLAVTEGTFLVVYQALGTSITLGTTGWAPVPNTGANVLKVWNSDSSTTSISPQNLETSDQAATICCVVSINAPGGVLAQIKLTTTVIPASGHFDLFITPLNTAIVT